MTFSHAAQMSGDYSVNVEGDPITSGQAVAGFILGCGISVAGGFTVGIEPNQGWVGALAPTVSPASTASAVSAPLATATPMPTSNASVVTPSAITPIARTPLTSPARAAITTTSPSSATTTPTSATTTPTSATTTPTSATTTPTTPTTPASATTPETTPTTPTTETTTPTTETTTPTTETTTTTTTASPPSIDLGPSVGGALGITEVLTATLGPGQVTIATTATSALDNTTVFPYRISFNNAALNVAQCASPVSAVPFVTTTVSTAQGVVQTTAYGDQFTF
ncbi:MspA family porin [Nocardia sp. CA-151230]|uniref:MspA family porin n=1 Tax=Nocardia sp. CA-151230 TaxID=3239982 RepID=UPI003D8C6044